jgi:hypothetical protein
MSTWSDRGKSCFLVAKYRAFLHYIALLNKCSTEINRSVSMEERALQWTLNSFTVSCLVYACITLSLSHCGNSPAVSACSNGSCSQTWQPRESSDVHFLSSPYPRRCVSQLCFCLQCPLCPCCHWCRMWPLSPAHGKLIFQKCNIVGF